MSLAWKVVECKGKLLKAFGIFENTFWLEKSLLLHGDEISIADLNQLYELKTTVDE